MDIITVKVDYSDSFNRTFMELKFNKVQIHDNSIPGFNRTFMELKCLHCSGWNSWCGFQSYLYGIEIQN